jgi:hypothetical protein
MRPHCLHFDRERMREQAAALAARGVHVGTSSWKYEGWLGQLYTAARYEYRGKVAKTRFERDCLKEYARFSRPYAWMRRITRFPRRSISSGWVRSCLPTFALASR